MSFDQYPPGQEPQSFAPVSLAYSAPVAYPPAQPGKTLATVMGVIGIVVASLTLLFVLYKVFQLSIAGTIARRMPWGTISQASLVVQAFDALVALVFSVVLMIGSIGLLRLRLWSRRLLIWWGLLYLAVLVVFLALELKIVVPDEAAMAGRIFANMPGMMNANGAVTGTFTATGSGGTTVATWSTTMPTTAPIVGSAVPINNGAIPATLGPPAKVSVVNANAVNPFASPQMATIMDWTYVVWAYLKVVMCGVFPIVLLITLRLKRMRAIFAPPPQSPA